MRKLEGKVAIVTGASRGIGRGIAQALASAGCSLLLTARTRPDLDATASQIRSQAGDVQSFAADVADADQMQHLFDMAQDKFGKLDLLVNNAGAFDGGPIDELPLQHWDRVIATNLRGPFICTQLAMRIMKKQKGGRIINIGSISAQRVRPRSAPYSAAKHGLWGLTQVTALEGRQYGITCCCLHPGNILVERRRGSEKPEDDEPMIDVADIAEVALLMATLPPNVEMLEAIVLPHQQPYVGRG